MRNYDFADFFGKKNKFTDLYLPVFQIYIEISFV